MLTLRRRLRSPYMISVPMQIRLCMARGFQRLQGDMSLALSGTIGNFVMALIIGSVFYNLPFNTGSFYSRGVLLFFAILLNAFSSSLEVRNQPIPRCLELWYHEWLTLHTQILTLYAQRPIVEKQAKYAFYHPFAEAVASMICDLPNKILSSIFFNLTLYFMTHLRRTPGAFFTFYLFSFTCTLAMSMVFRTIGALSRSLAQAMAPAAVFILALVIYTGFAVPIRDMHPWFRWINYLDPVAYAFESLMINEVRVSSMLGNITFTDRIASSQDNGIPAQHLCLRVQAIPTFHRTSAYVRLTVLLRAEPSLTVNSISTPLSITAIPIFGGEASKRLSCHPLTYSRNLGILFAFVVFGCATYLVAAEFVSAKRSKGEVLLFRRGQVPSLSPPADEEAKSADRVTSQDLTRQVTVPAAIQKQTAVFHWDGVNYDIKIKGEPRKLLDDVDGWVKPGTLTALMVRSRPIHTRGNEIR
jgi:ATP-binding cassette, subfamily G (WHITE), member 2, PDR